MIKEMRASELGPGMVLQLFGIKCKIINVQPVPTDHIQITTSPLIEPLQSEVFKNTKITTTIPMDRYIFVAQVKE
jgi:hypothetical protein